MSAGSFIRVAYQASYNANAVHPIRVQPETLALSVTIAGAAVVNTAATQAITTPTGVRVSAGRRSRGVNARLIRIQFTDVTPEGYKPGSTITLPALNAALLAAPNGASGTYQGLPITVIGTSPETVR